MKSIEQNKALIQQMIAAITQHGFMTQADFFADRVINHGLPVTRAEIRHVLADIATTFPDVNLEPLNILADADWVVVRCYFHGTHRGMGQHPFVHEGLLAGVPPTGKRVRVQHIHMFRLQDGRIIEHWATRDDIDMARQLGLFPSTATAAAS